MKNSKFRKITLSILLVLTVFVTIVFARPTEDRDNHGWSGIHTFEGLSNLVFEGAIRDGTNKTTFTVTEPTAARTITIPDADVTLGNTDAHTSATTITVTDTTTNTVTDLLTLDHSGGTPVAGFGTGIAFKHEDDTGTTTEEHASIDIVSTDPTTTTEDTDMVFKVMTNGDVTEQFRLVSAESATTGDYFQFTSNTTELNAEITTGIYKLTSVGTEATGLGATHEYWMVDAGGGEIQAEFATVFTTITDSAEDVDLVWRQNDNGTVSESLRIIADADGTTEGTRLQITSRSAETNGVNHTIISKADGGTTVAGFGNGIDLQGEFADGTETICQIDAVWTDVSTGSEDGDLAINCKDAGGTVELLRFDSDGNIQMEGATADSNQLTIIAADPAADKDITLPSTVDSAAMISSLITNDVDVANSIWGVSNGLAFGGATGANGFEVTVSLGADPGADVALTLPVASGALVTATSTGSFKTVESLTATNVQTSADCGKTLLLTHATVAIVVTLPAPAGLSGCEFWVRHNLATNQDHTVVTNASANIIRGSTIDNNTPPGSYQAAGDVITFVNSAESIGDYIHLITDGTSWFVDGVAELNGGITQGST